jgi:hypothetical protein
VASPVGDGGGVGDDQVGARPVADAPHVGQAGPLGGKGGGAVDGFFQAQQSQLPAVAAEQPGKRAVGGWIGFAGHGERGVADQAQRGWQSNSRSGESSVWSPENVGTATAAPRRVRRAICS